MGITNNPTGQIRYVPFSLASVGMHQVLDPESNDTALQMALKCVHTTLRRKILGSPNDVIGVLLYGSEKKFGINDFEHLSLILPLDIPEAKSIQNIENYTGLCTA